MKCSRIINILRNYIIFIRHWNLLLCYEGDSMKKILSLLIILSMIAGLAPASVHAQADESDYRFGTVEYYSTYTSGETIQDGFYYSDDWFFEDPAEWNDALALVSMQLTAAAADSSADGLGTAFLSELGFEKTGFYGSNGADPDGCNYTWGKKTIRSGSKSCTLIAVAVQSYAFDTATKHQGWYQNFWINRETRTSLHDSFAAAIDGCIESVADLAEDGNVCYWITGQSRGGALAGLLAAELPDKLAESADGIYAYTFEAPAYVDADAVSETDYSYIHNYLCTDDIVTMIPPWGMTRYGSETILNIEENDAGLSEELQKMGSMAYELQAEENEIYADTEATALSILETLTASIPAREDYSAGNTDFITDENGEEIVLSYVYQDLFLHLMDIIFGDGLGEIPTDAIIENLGGLVQPLSSLVRAVSDQSEPDYYAAATGLWDFLDAQGFTLPLSKEEVYALLKLAGPLLVDTEYVPESDQATTEDVVLYLTPVLTLVGNVNYLVFSHHFDTLIARLHLLAPEPAMENIDLMIPVPAGGDSAADAPNAVLESVDALSLPWLTVEAAWQTDDETLKNDQVYYLDITLNAVGHDMPEDFAFTLNGSAPIKKPDIVYQNGIFIIKGTWSFSLGTPENVTVSFDTAGYTETPDPVSVPAGSLLKYVLSPAQYDTITYNDCLWTLDNWYDVNGVCWENLSADQDMVLYARWIELIDTLSFNIPIPKVGEDCQPPTSAQEDKYVVTDIDYMDDTWDSITTITSPGWYHVTFNISPASDAVRLLLDEDEWGGFDFTGKLVINGNEIEFNTYQDYAASLNYDEDLGQLWVKYSFQPLTDISTVTLKQAVYSGKKQVPTVVTADGTVLIENVDYTWSAKDGSTSFVNAGTYPITLTGIGNYTGSKSAKFVIKAKKVTPTVTLSAKKYTYNGKIKKPTVTVKAGKKTLDSSDYTVSYASGRKKVGTYKVTVKLKGNYSGKKSVTFKIVPKGTSITGLKKAKNGFTVKWKKQAMKMSRYRISGYQIQYASDDAFTKNEKKVTLHGYKNVSKRITGLKGGKKYYVRIRTFRKIGENTYYSSWSKVKTVTTKK